MIDPDPDSKGDSGRLRGGLSGGDNQLLRGALSGGDNQLLRGGLRRGENRLLRGGPWDRRRPRDEDQQETDAATRTQTDFTDNVGLTVIMPRGKIIN